MADNGKTFTQEEVNAIVSGRVNEIESRYSGYVSAEDHQKEVDRANGLQTKLDGIEKANKLSEMRSKVSKEKGIPVELLTGETEDACNDQADKILKFAGGNQKKYPGAKKGAKPNPGQNDNDYDDWKEFATELFGN